LAESGHRSVLLAGDTPAVVSDESLTAYSSSGRQLWQEKLPAGFALQPLAMPDGAVLVANAAGEVRKLRGKPPWRTQLPVKPSTAGGLALSTGKLFVTLGSQLFVLDAASGQLLSKLDLPGIAWGAPRVGGAGTVAITFETEVWVVDGAGRVLARASTPSKISGTAVVTPEGNLIALGQDGHVWTGKQGTLGALVALGGHGHGGPVLTPDSAVLVLTGEEILYGASTLHKLALPSGRELFRLKLGQSVREPALDVRGTAWFIDQDGLVQVDANGAQRWSLDLRGNQGASPPLLGAKGTLYFRSFKRLSAFQVRAAAPFAAAQ
jgi:outer membrane protein assembly factor BamB